VSHFEVSVSYFSFKLAAVYVIAFVVAPPVDLIRKLLDQLKIVVHDFVLETVLESVVETLLNIIVYREPLRSIYFINLGRHFDLIIDVLDQKEFNMFFGHGFNGNVFFFLDHTPDIEVNFFFDLPNSRFQLRFVLILFSLGEVQFGFFSVGVLVHDWR